MAKSQQGKLVLGGVAAASETAEEIGLPRDILDDTINILGLAENLVNFDVDDEDMGGGAKATSSAGPRHSESKKEMLKVVENTINRLKKEDEELGKVHQQLSEGEAKAEKEVQAYRKIIEQLERFDTSKLHSKEFEKFFELHFVGGGINKDSIDMPPAVMALVPQFKKLAKAGVNVGGADENKKTDMDNMEMD